MDDFRVEINDIELQEFISRAPGCMKRLAKSYTAANGEAMVIVNAYDLKVCLALAGLWLADDDK